MRGFLMLAFVSVMLKIEAWYEAKFLRLAAYLLDRNVKRSRVITRHDNNWLFEAEHEIRNIAERIERGYQGENS